MAFSPSGSKWAVRGSVIGLLVVLSFLAGFSILAQSRDAASSRRVASSNLVASVYQDTRFWVGHEKDLVSQYRVHPSRATVGLLEEASQAQTQRFRRLARLDPSRANRAVVEELLGLDIAYVQAARVLFLDLGGHQAGLIRAAQAGADRIYKVIQSTVLDRAGLASRRSLAEAAALRRSDVARTRTIAIAFGLGVLLLVGLGLVIDYFRRLRDATLLAELKRLEEVAVTDPLTGLHNHRAFQEKLNRSVQEAGRSAAPLSLIMLDHDELKAVNDNLGHQAGDEQLQLLADGIRATERGTECSYRIGGDEFGVIVEGTRAWNALEFTQRLSAHLVAEGSGAPVRVTAGVAELRAGSDKDVLIREAGLALIAAKRSGNAAAIYSPAMEPNAVGVDAENSHHTQTLASALALAVDAKDSYTRSHSQTVSELSALIGAELGFAPAHIEKMRIAGLLHDVGKIGIPDAILNKPAKLTNAEYDVMKTHSVLGYNIVLAADLPTEAEWIRHHHSRWDGQGYPDHVAGEKIPLESRIIFVADSFEAMTSDRPYRKAPGHQFALEELRRNSGTQFDPRVVDAICRTVASPTRDENDASSNLAPDPQLTTV